MNPYFLALIIYLLWGAGLIALAAALLFRKLSDRVFTQTVAKTLIAVCRFFSAMTTFVTNPSNPTESFLWWAKWAAPSAYLLWELVGVSADGRSKVVAAQVAILEKNIQGLRALLTALRDSIATKRTMIARSIKELSGAPGPDPLSAKQRLQLVRTTLDPPERVSELLKGLTNLLIHESQSAGRSIPQSFRACLYLEEAGFMVEKASFDSQTQTIAGTRSSTLPALRPKFQISNEVDPSVIVASIQQRTPVFIPDCAAEHRTRKKAKKVFYFNEAQQQYLKSLVCYPFNLSHDPKKERWAVLAVDTNVAGHFKADANGFFEASLVEYLKRIDLELIYEELLGPPIGPDRRANST